MKEYATSRQYDMFSFVYCIDYMFIHCIMWLWLLLNILGFSVFGYKS